jgi:hypothetical protein
LQWYADTVFPQHSDFFGRGEFCFKLALAMQFEMNWESVVLELACEWDAAFWRAGDFLFRTAFLAYARPGLPTHTSSSTRRGDLERELQPLACGDKRTDGTWRADWLLRAALGLGLRRRGWNGMIMVHS